jgi:hypothetical protein
MKKFLIMIPKILIFQFIFSNILNFCLFKIEIYHLLYQIIILLNFCRNVMEKVVLGFKQNFFEKLE